MLTVIENVASGHLSATSSEKDDVSHHSTKWTQAFLHQSDHHQCSDPGFIQLRLDVVQLLTCKRAKWRSTRLHAKYPQTVQTTQNEGQKRKLRRLGHIQSQIVSQSVSYGKTKINYRAYDKLIDQKRNTRQASDSR